MANADSTERKRDTNTGFHAPAENDAPATRWMLAIIIGLLTVGTVIAVLAYRNYNNGGKYPPATEQVPPPLNP